MSGFWLFMLAGLVGSFAGLCLAALLVWLAYRWANAFELQERRKRAASIALAWSDCIVRSKS